MYCPECYNITSLIGITVFHKMAMNILSSKERINLSHGPLLQELLLFSAPILLTGILQLLFYVADMAVIGRYASPQSLGAVGGASQVSSLLMVLFIGMSIGTNVVVANHFGAKDRKMVSRAAHTSIMLSIICGLFVASIAFALAEPMLALTKIPEEVLGSSTTYFKIICIGMPFSMVFNFAAAILRAVGDTKTPLYNLTIAGVVNVVLNLVFVINFKMDVAGVAYATAISNFISAALTIYKLFVIRESCRINISLLHIDGRLCWNILKIGLPAGFQSAMYGLGTIIIQTGVNSFGPLAMAGSAASGAIEGVIFVGIHSFDQAITTSVGQNSGARKFGRLVKSLYFSTFLMIAYVFIVGGLAFYFADDCIGFFVSNSAPDAFNKAVEFGVGRLQVMSLLYILDGVMINITATLRALGHSVFPAAVTLAGAFLFRVVWVFWIFPYNPTMMFLWSCMPISWIVISSINGTYLHSILAELRKTHMRVGSAHG